jgi:hypothetical protein
MNTSRNLMIALGALILGIVGTTGFFYLRHNEAAVPFLGGERQAVGETHQLGVFLTPEQEAMWRRDHKAEMKAMTKDQKKAFRKQFRQQWEAMNEADRTKLRNDLQAKWDALPANQREKLEQRILQHGKGGSGHGKNGTAQDMQPKSSDNNDDD